MSAHIRTLRHQCIVHCDACGEQRKTKAADGSGWNEQHQFHRDLISDGWRIFAGRSRRYYCPNCCPKPGHKMLEVTR